MQAVRVLIVSCLLLAGATFHVPSAQALSIVTLPRLISCKYYEPGKTSFFAPVSVKRYFSALPSQIPSGTKLEVCSYEGGRRTYDVWIPQPKMGGVCLYHGFDQEGRLRDDPQSPYTLRDLLAAPDRDFTTAMLAADGVCPDVEGANMVVTEGVSQELFLEIQKAWDSARASPAVLDAMLAPAIRNDASVGLLRKRLANTKKSTRARAIIMAAGELALHIEGTHPDFVVPDDVLVLERHDSGIAIIGAYISSR